MLIAMLVMIVGVLLRSATGSLLILMLATLSALFRLGRLAGQVFQLILLPQWLH